jgi:thioredoxin-dependent peroxiredoxin
MASTKKPLGPRVGKKSAAKPAKKLAKKPAKKLAQKSAKPGSDPAAKLQPGMKAPAFSLPRDGGGTVSLADFAGEKLVVYFYPRASTTGCTKESIDFSRLESAFGRAGTKVVGVSADPVPAQDKFKAKYKLTIPLASDEKHRMLEAYGVWQEKSLYGRKFMGIVRTTVLIGGDGKVARVWPKVSVDGHAADVLEAAKAL